MSAQTKTAVPAVAIGGTYTDVTIPAAMAVVPLPPSVRGAIKPGSLDHLTQVQTICWGVNMTGLIEPNTVPAKAISLFLPKTYKHDLALSQFSELVQVLIHKDNANQVPKGMNVLIWSESEDISGNDALLYGHSSLPNTEVTPCSIATMATGSDCYCRWARCKLDGETDFVETDDESEVDEESDEEEIFDDEDDTEEAPIPANAGALDDEAFRQMLAQSQGSDPRLVEAKAIAVIIGQYLYADVAAAHAKHTVHNGFSFMYEAGPLFEGELYRNAIIAALQVAFPPKFSFTRCVDAPTFVCVSFNC
ncbi:Hypothetical protein MVR_LOCUS18 [uncultured virus]|nr:Hypothetical protein MVR_LOCUS18 [uncultured virus]